MIAFDCGTNSVTQNPIESNQVLQMDSNILHWSYRDFREFPTELIEHCDTVEEIYLKENFIPALPHWLFEFVHLKFIQLSGNLLQTIPNEIGNLINLEHLDVSKNQLNGIPVQITQLNKLQYLDVSANEITILPKGKPNTHISNVRHIVIR